MSTRRPRVAVIGAGFAGIGVGMALRDAGWTERELTILDRADGVGGVWRANTYPGAACDVPSHLYSFANEPGREWTRRFAPQADILRYLERLTAERGLTGCLRLSTEVTEARWDDAQAVWRLSLTGGDTLEAEVLVPACGQLSRPVRPAITGLDRFRGPVFHSAEWDHDVDLAGRRVAVIGTGASAGQFVPRIVEATAHLTVFQRSAPYVVPKPDRRYGAFSRAVLMRLPPWYRGARAFWWVFFEWAGRRIVEPRRPGGGAFAFLSRTSLRRQVRDAAVRAQLTPGYRIGGKRIVIASDFYPVFARPDATLVTESITEVTGHGIRTADGTDHPADVIILGTGFASTDFLTPMKVFGADGRELSQEWRDGAAAHLGVTVPGFPNLFLLYGPNTNLGSGSIVHMIECQIGYLRQALDLLRSGVRTLTVRPEVAQAFDAEVQERMTGTAWTDCTSWYRTGSGRVVANWPGTMREYAARTATLDPTDFVTTR